MKRLILLRHAKSSWVNPDLDDFDRPLNKRGRRSAKALGKWLRDSGHAPGQILCSAARRTRETWEELKLPGMPELRQDLYHATAEGMLAALRAAEAQCVLLIGHNPGIAQLAQSIVSEAPDHGRFGDFPTGSLLIADFEIKKWGKIAPHSGNVAAFLTPHDLIENAG